MASFKSCIDVLTDDERMAWHDRDRVGFFEWYARWVNIDISVAQGKKVPRHRFNKKNPRMP